MFESGIGRNTLSQTLNTITCTEHALSATLCVTKIDDTQTQINPNK